MIPSNKEHANLQAAIKSITGGRFQQQFLDAVDDLISRDINLVFAEKVL
jgi:hypothetical protein